MSGASRLCGSVSNAENEKSQRALIARSEKYAEYSKRNNEDHDEITGEEEKR